jgi:hypothetical protein
MLGVKSSPFSPYAAGGLARGNAGQPRHDPRLHNMSHDHRGATIRYRGVAHGPAEADEHDVVASAIALRRVRGLCVTTNTPSRRLGDYVSRAERVFGRRRAWVAARTHPRLLLGPWRGSLSRR